MGAAVCGSIEEAREVAGSVTAFAFAFVWATKGRSAGEKKGRSTGRTGQEHRDNECIGEVRTGADSGEYRLAGVVKVHITAESCVVRRWFQMCTGRDGYGQSAGSRGWCM